MFKKTHSVELRGEDWELGLGSHSLDPVGLLEWGRGLPVPRIFYESPFPYFPLSGNAMPFTSMKMESYFTNI